MILANSLFAFFGLNVIVSSLFCSSITGCSATRKLHLWKLNNINKDAGCDGVRLAEPHPGKRCPIDMTATCLFPHATEPGLRLERAGDRLSVMPANLTESSTASKSASKSL